MRLIHAALMVGLSSIPAQAADIDFAVAEYDGATQCLEQAVLIGVTGCTQYYQVGKTAKITHADLPASMVPTIALQFTAKAGGVHQNVLNGSYDADLNQLVQLIKSDGRPVRFRVFPEPNGFWSKEGVYVDGQNFATYRAAKDYVYDYLLAGLGAEMILDFELNLSRASFDRDRQRVGVADFAEYVSPRDTVISASSYNRCGTSPERTEIKPFAEEFSGFYEAALEFGLPIGVAEVATSPYCGVDMTAWYEDMFASLETQFTAVSFVQFFFENKAPGTASNTVETQWGAILTENPDVLRRLVATRQSAAAILPVVETTQVAQVRPQARQTPQRAAPTQPEQRPVLSVSKEPIQKTDITHGSAVTAPEAELSFGRRFEYAGWLNLTHAIGDEPIPGYGQAGLLAQGNIRFSYVPESGSVRSGPYVLFGGVASNNCDPRYWQCQVRAEVGYSWSFDNRAGWPYDSDYNSLRFDIGVGHRHYWQDAGRPGRLDQGDTYGQVGLTWTFGGAIGQ